MIDINAALTSLNAGYTQINSLINTPYYFSDEEADSINNDPYWDGTGYVQTICIQSNDKVVLGGYSNYYDPATDTSFSVLKRFDSSGNLDESFTSAWFSGWDQFVRVVIQQSSGKLIVGGPFSTVDGTNVQGIARLNTDGTYDSSFNSGQVGFDAQVIDAKFLSDGSIICVGSFTNYNGDGITRVAKLSANGVLDATFRTNINLVNIGNTVHTVYVDSSDKIYIGGQFTNKIKKLNSDGTEDLSFDVGVGFNGNRVSSIAQQSDNKLIIGGWFTQYKGVNCNPNIVRLELNGDIDGTFQSDGTGLNGPENNNASVQKVYIQSNGRILVGGFFTEYNGTSQNRLIRLLANGTKDTSLDIGTGFDDRVQNLNVNNSGNILVTGFFDQYKGENLKAPFNFGGGNTYGVAFLDSTGNILGDNFVPNISYVGISDGGDDMYDGANYHNTNLTQLYNDIKDDNVNSNLSIPITHTPAAGEGDNDYTNPPMDGVVKNGSDYFGAGSQYFTNMYPNLFVLVATNVNVDEFSICGNLGSDGSGIDVSQIFPLSAGGIDYTCFFKCNYGAGDPSVNHLIIVPGTSSGITVLYDNAGRWDDHCLQGITGRDTIVVGVFAKENGGQVSTEEATEIAQKLIDVVASGASQTYEMVLTPPDRAIEGSDGNLDFILVDGKSIQRSVYLEVLNSPKLRKVTELKDGESTTNQLQKLTDLSNTGHKFIKS